MDGFVVTIISHYSFVTVKPIRCSYFKQKGFHLFLPKNQIIRINQLLHVSDHPRFLHAAIVKRGE